MLSAGAGAQEPASLEPRPDPRPGLVRLAPEYDVWIDKTKKQVLLGGEVCLREGALEMFACPRNTKEHESILAVLTKSQVVHAALLAVGAEVGSPVSFEPEYRPARGTKIDIELDWTDEAGKPRHARAADWVRNHRTGKSLDTLWVFGGSGFWEDPNNGQRFYLAEEGDLICVSNFSSAMLDLPIPSSQSNEELLFVAWTERIPPVGTKVLMTLVPQQEHATSGSAGVGTRPAGRGKRRGR